jgi:predicted O-methyltransferase YrrM
MQSNPYLRGVKKIRLLVKYIRYYLGASTKHEIHSPFVFELLTKVIEDKTQLPVYSEIEGLRKSLLQNDAELTVLDLGAGSHAIKGKKRKISDIVRCSSKSPKYAQLLSRLCNRFRPAEILELGTSLGISTLYLHAGNPDSTLTSMEGCPELAEKARQNIDSLNKQGIRILQGDFQSLLPGYLDSVTKLDLVFFDGNHSKKPTLAYFNQCLAKTHAETLFIFDDIHWSDEMDEAWEEIKKHPAVTVSIDLFFIGLVFFRTGQEKQHFTIRF